ncbi:MAG: ATP-binding cassette domain-containing protein [Gemmatimonadota bacterium]
MSQAILSLSGVGKTFGAGLHGSREPVVALEGVCGEVNAGEIVGVAGARGAGKTTLLRVAAGVLHADSGVVRWRGAARYPPHFAAFVLADVALHAFLSVRESLRFAFVQRELRETPRRVAEDLWPARLDLLGRLDARVGELSLAERRVVALAAAMQESPELLVLDGLLDGLDPAARRELRRVLHIVAASGVAVLVSAADLGALSGVAHRGALLRAGRVIAWIDPRHAAPCTALELAVGAPRTAAARLRAHVAAACRRDGAVRVSLADRSAEEVLALCRAEGIRVLRSRVVTEPAGRWTVPRAPG